MPTATKYLDPPDVHVFLDASGEPEGVHVSFRPRGVKYAYAVQPEMGTFFDVYLDAADEPVFLALDEELEGGRLVRSVDAVLRGLPTADGTRLIDEETAAILLRGLFRGLAEFRPAPPPPTVVPA